MALIGCFYGFLTPGSLGVYSLVFYLKEETNEPLGKLFVNMVIKMTILLIPSYLIITICALFPVKQYPVILLVVITYISIMSLILLYLIKKERREKLFHKLIKYLIPKRFKSSATKFTETFYKDMLRIRDLISPFILALFIDIVAYLQLYVTAWFLGIVIPFYIFVVIFALAGIAALIPISIGGLGTKQAALILLLSPFGIEAQKVLAFSLVNLTFSGIIVGCTGLILALTEARNNKKLSEFKTLVLLPKKLSFIKIIKANSISKK